MAGKRKGSSPYRRAEQKTTLIPPRTPGNHPVPQQDDGVVPQLDRLIVPGQSPLTERVIERRITQQSFDGPLPHPEIFRQYGQVIKNAPERILKVFEEDSEHLRYMQREALKAQRDDSQRVQWMAFSLIAGGYAMAAWFAYMEKNALAGIVLTTTIIGTVVGFLQNRHQRGGPSPEDKGSSSDTQKPADSKQQENEEAES